MRMCNMLEAWNTATVLEEGVAQTGSVPTTAVSTAVHSRQMMPTLHLALCKQYKSKIELPLQFTCVLQIFISFRPWLVLVPRVLWVAIVVS